MSILKILPSAIDATANYTFGSVISNGVDLGATVAAAYNAANTVSPLDSYARQTANAAFDKANTSITTSGGTITGNLTVNAFTANTITANGVDLGTAVASAFLLANSANKTTTSDTAPSSPKVGDTWYDTITSITFRYNNDGVSNNWIDISGPQNAGYIFQSYSLSSNTTSLNESGSNTSVALTVSTINIADDTTLYWTISGSTGPDFTDGSNSGSVNITNNSATIIRTLTADVSTEGAESFIAQLRTGSTSGPIVAIAPVITVADTSMAPVYALYVFGSSGNGQLGLNDTEFRSSPTQVGSGTIWNEISVGNNGAMATKTDGTLWTWGSNAYGELGLNDRIDRSSPTQVGTLTNWSKIATGSYFRIAVRTDGTMWSWGTGPALGLNISTGYRSSPTQVGALTTWKNVASGSYASHVLATDTNNYLYAWGTNGYGQLGTNDRIYKSSPVQVSQIGWYTGSLAATSTNSFANGVGGGGSQIYLYAWGWNGSGELGTNNTIARSSPVQVGGLDWKNFATHQNHKMATKSDGTLWLWGNNSYGQLGLNSVSSTYRSSPVQVGTATDWATIACGYQTNFATKTNGTLWSWGGNAFGQAGRPDLVTRSSPTQIGTNTNWNKIAVGSFTTLLTTSS